MSVRSPLVVCPVCRNPVRDVADLASHLVDEAARSDGGHVMWLNRHVTKDRMPPMELQVLLEEALSGAGSSGDRVAR